MPQHHFTVPLSVTQRCGMIAKPCSMKRKVGRQQRQAAVQVIPRMKETSVKLILI